MLRRSVGCLLLVAVPTACRDNSPEPPKPAALEIVAGASQTGTAGSAVPTTPAFLVRDQNGRPLSGVAVTIAVAAGGGTLTGAPTRTAEGGPTPIGTWTLGPKVGENKLTITVAGLPTATLAVTSGPGAPAKLVARSATTLEGVVGEAIAPAPVAQLTDAFENPIPSATVAVALTGGGSAAPSITAGPEGLVSVGAWTLGTLKGSNTLTMTAGPATVIFTATAAPGPRCL